MVAAPRGTRNVARRARALRVERSGIVRHRIYRAASAVGGGLLAAASVAFYHVHDLASLSAVLHHLMRDWYEVPVFLAVACPLLYVLERRAVVARTDAVAPPSP